MKINQTIYIYIHIYIYIYNIYIYTYIYNVNKNIYTFIYIYIYIYNILTDLWSTKQNLKIKNIFSDVVYEVLVMKEY